MEESASKVPGTQSHDRRVRYQALGLALLCGLLCRYFWDFKPVGMLHDDAGYLQGALELLGREQEGLNLYSKGPSLMVLPYLALFPQDLQGVRAVPTLFSTLWVGLFFFYIRSFIPERVALPVALCAFTSAGFLLNASNVMGEPFLGFFLWSALSLVSWGSPRRGTRMVAAVCVVAAGFMRTEGILLAVAIATWEFLSGRWRRGLEFGGAVLTCYALAHLLLTNRNPGVHGGQLSGYFADPAVLLSYPLQWFTKFLSTLGGSFVLGLPAESPWSGLALGVGLLVAALAVKGWFGVGLSGRSGLLKVALVVLLGALFFWPYLQPRHLLSVWPMLLVCSVLALPSRFQQGFAWALWAVMLLIGLPNLSSGMQARSHINSGFLKTVEWVRANTPGDSVVMTGMPSTYAVLADRKVVEYRRNSAFPALLADIDHAKVSYLVWENSYLTIPDVAGVPQGGVGAQLDLWLQHSPSLRRAATNDYATIYQVLPPPHFEQAYRLWRDSLEPSQSPETRRKLLEDANAASPDLPFVQAALVDLDIFQERLESARDRLEAYLKQYPFELSSLYNLTVVTERLGERERARQFAQYGQSLAVESGNSDLAQLFSAFLASSR